MERKLASIQVIRKLIPIKGADFIELALVNDWTCIVKKGEFSEGDLCVYFEIDSMLPEDSRYSFLESSKRDYFGTTKYRIKTMKMRGVISQGLALPLYMYPEITQKISIGQDVTEALGIVKYDPEFYTDNGGKAKTGNAKGRFPSFIPKTDQERIQNLPHYYELYEDHLWEETLKLDGSSLTVYKVDKPITLWDKIKGWFGVKVKDYHLGVCSRNLELKPNDNFTKSFNNDGKLSEHVQSDFWRIVIQLDIEEYLPKGFALQGELIGPKIQANHEKVSENQFWIFDVYDINQGRYLMPQERQEFVNSHFPKNIMHVPVVNHSIKLFSECKTLEDLQKRVTGESINSGTVSEGRVYKSCSIAGLSFKCISNDYLLKAE